MLYAKESNPETTRLVEGFWGLSVKIIAAFKEQRSWPWVVILLKDADFVGLLFDSDTVLAKVDKNWPPIISYGYNYRVREDIPGDLDGGVSFSSIAGMSKLLDPLMKEISRPLRLGVAQNI